MNINTHSHRLKLSFKKIFHLVASNLSFCDKTKIRNNFLGAESEKEEAIRVIGYITACGCRPTPKSRIFCIRPRPPLLEGRTTQHDNVGTADRSRLKNAHAIHKRLCILPKVFHLFTDISRTKALIEKAKVIKFLIYTFIFHMSVIPDL